MSKIAQVSVQERYCRSEESNLRLKEARESSYADVTFRVGDCLFPVHKCVLFWNSPVLERMLSHDTMDKYKDEIELKDLDEISFRLVLDYLYSGEIVITSENVIGILRVCDYLEMASLRSFCVSFLSKILKPDTAVEVHQLAYWFNEDLLKNEAQKVIAENLIQAQEGINHCTTEELLSILVTGLSSSTEPHLNDEQALFLILGWIKTDFEQRRSCFENLTNLLNLGTVTIKFLRVQIFDELVMQNPEFRERMIRVLADKLELIVDKPEGRLKQTFHGLKNAPANANIFSAKKEYVQDFPWELSVRKNTNGFGEPALSVYAYCNRAAEKSWSCNASLRFRLIPFRQGVRVKEFKVDNFRFSSSLNSWGFHRFMSWETLMNPRNGYVGEEGHVTLELVVAHTEPVAKS